MSKGNIFICYRHEDSSAYTGWLADALGKKFGRDRVLRDLDSQRGVDFRDQVGEAIDSCAVLLAVIGPKWLRVQDESGRRRIDHPRDLVALEIDAALKRDIRVVPVLVAGARMPREADLPEHLAALAYRTAIELSDAGWDHQISGLVDALQRVVDPAPGSPSTPPLAPSGVSGAGNETESGSAKTTSPMTIGNLSGAGNDTVGTVDQLGFKHYVNAFVDLITSKHTQPPLTIGIFGSWGMGKSFLLWNIEREIDIRQSENPDAVPRVHVVRFNAWQYSAMEVVWPALVRTIVTTLDKLNTWPWYKRVSTRLRWNLARQWRELRAQLMAGALVVAAVIAAAIAQEQAGVAAAVGGVAAALGIGGVLKAANDPVAQWITALFADRDYGRQLRVMEDIKHDLKRLEERLHEDGDPEASATGRILILVDDLDRCEPAKAVEVLQAVNLLLNFNSFIVCLGIDARIVTGAVERHYEGLLGKAGASGYEYLDKIVQIPFRIPEPSREDILTFVASQLGNPEHPPTQKERDGGQASSGQPTTGDGTDSDADRDGARGPVSAPDFAPDTAVSFTYVEQQAFALFADYLRPNPRHLKRLVNVYRLVRALAQARQERLILERPAATIRWLVMWSQWPYASLAMMERCEQLMDEWRGRTPGKEFDGDPLMRLLESVEDKLDGSMRERLDDDPDDLRKLLSIEGCELSWDEILRIRPFTVNFNPAVEDQVRQPMGEA